MDKYADFRNIKVRYTDKGKGRVVVLLHGFLESTEVFNELSDRLSKSYRVICIDLPGHGKTPVLGYSHNMELMAECVHEVLENLYFSRYVLVGHSMGGYVALAYAELFPECVCGLCLLHSTAVADTPERKKDRDRMVEAVKTDHIKFIGELIPKLFAHANHEILRHKVEETKHIALRTSKEGIVAALMGMKNRPPREHVLRDAKFPVLFIIGKEDTILAWENLILLATIPKKSYQLALEHSGHMGFYEAPEEVFKMLRKFAGICFRKTPV